MLKRSKYTTILKSENEYIFYNACTGQHATVHKDEVYMGYIEENADYEYYEQTIAKSTMEMLIKKGFFITCNLDEEQLLQDFIQKDYSETENLRITLIPTMQCNFLCKYCYQDHNPRKMSEEIMNAVIKFVINEMKRFDTIKIAWFGGEPLCALDSIYSTMRKIAIAAAVNKVKLESAMSTNGYLLKPDVFKQLYGLGVYGYQITVDGPAHIHDSFRIKSNGDPTFEQIMSNLLYIRDNQAYDRARILIRINMSNKLLPYMEEFIRYLGSTFGQDHRFLIDFQQMTDMGGPGIESVREEIIGKQQDVSHYLKILREYQVGNREQDVLVNKGGYVCYAGRKNAYVIDVEGNVRKCTVALNDEINCIGYIDKMGQMHLDKLKAAMWNEKVGCHELAKCKFYPLCFGKACPYKAILGKQYLCRKENCITYLKAMEEA